MPITTQSDLFILDCDVNTPMQAVISLGHCYEFDTCAVGLENAV